MMRRKRRFRFRRRFAGMSFMGTLRMSIHLYHAPGWLAIDCAGFMQRWPMLTCVRVSQTAHTAAAAHRRSPGQHRVQPMRLFSVAIAVLLLSTASLVGCTGMRAAKLYQTGTRALNAGDGELAVERLSEASRLKPEASEIQNHLGLAYSVAGQPEQALAAFERAVDLDCSNTAAATNLAAAREAATDRRQLATTRSTGDP